MLGIAGFLPLSPREAHIAGLTPEMTARIEQAWTALDASFLELVGTVGDWEQVRVRPGNQPLGRIVSAAALLASASRGGGLLPAMSALVQESSDLVRTFRALTASEFTPGIGADRTIDMLASGVLPFMLALSRHVGDTSLADAAAAHWTKLPASAANHRAHRAARQVAGPAKLGRIGARGSQGLIQLDTALCQPRRCFECPIARLELEVNA